MEKLVTKRVSNLQKDFEGQKYVTAQSSGNKKLKIDESKKEQSKKHKKMFSNVFGKLFKKKNKNDVEEKLQDDRTVNAKPKENNAKKNRFKLLAQKQQKFFGAIYIWRFVDYFFSFDVCQ